MNTTEVKTKGIVKSFEDLWKYARKQFLEYEKLEGIPDWEEYDFSIDCSEDQMKFKDMLQIRCIEELTEATQALDNEEHFYEEVTDALNFFLSAYCMLGVDFKKPALEEGKTWQEIAETCLALGQGGDYLEMKKIFENNDQDAKDDLFVFFYYIVEKIGALCNHLKNRPWAQSNYLVSMHDFNSDLKGLWICFWDVLGCLDLSKEQIFDLFERKYLVNKFRIESGY